MVTGASRGAGRAAALECAAAGFSVVAAVRDPTQVDDLVREAGARGHRLSLEQLDVAAPGAAAKARELVLKYGPFFGLVNAATVEVVGPLEATREEAARGAFDASLFGAMALSRALLPAMRAAGRGRIVNVSGPCGRVGVPGLSAVSALDHAVRGFSEALRHEVSPFGVDVCVVEAGHLVGGRQAEPRSGPPPSDLPPAAYERLREALGRVLEARSADDEAVGKVVARVLQASSPPLVTPSSVDATTLVALRALLPDRVFASAIRRLR